MLFGFAKRCPGRRTIQRRLPIHFFPRSSSFNLRDGKTASRIGTIRRTKSIRGKPDTPDVCVRRVGASSSCACAERESTSAVNCSPISRMSDVCDTVRFAAKAARQHPKAAVSAKQTESMRLSRKRFFMTLLPCSCRRMSTAYARPFPFFQFIQFSRDPSSDAPSNAAMRGGVHVYSFHASHVPRQDCAIPLCAPEQE